MTIINTVIQMRKPLLLFVVFLCSAMQISAHTRMNERPKLVVGIVVDQMRWDYLPRYYDQFGNDGFKRLVEEGYSCDNCLINYLPTVTAIGHTSVYTGTTPAMHGICGNDFFIDDKPVYCCGDTTVNTVGSDSNKGEMSPHNLLSTTIGDQLRMHTDFHSKVIGVSYKDRAAILPAGRSANGAYWLDTKNVCFISSTYYMDELPDWAKAYNNELKKNKKAQELNRKIGFDPICGTVTTDMAIAALKGEKLGKGDVTDMLCVSYSQTDVIGHEWGTRGEHTDGAYLQLDKDLARLLKALDEHVGKGNYLLFLTADHGGAHNYQWMIDHKLNGGAWRVKEDVLASGLEAYLKEKLGADLSVINGINGYRVFLNHGRIKELGLAVTQVKEALIDYVRQMPHVQFVMDFEKVNTWSVPDVLRNRALLGYHPHRSGDLLMVLEAGWYELWPSSSKVGTTHGEWNPYDSHIPLLFYGWKVKPGSTSREVHITDIAPTVTQMLHIQQPNACVGEAITEITDED